MDVLYEETMTGTATYIYGPSGRLAKRTTMNMETTTFYYHTDRLDSTRLVTDENKEIVFAARYTPFGKAHSKEGAESYLFSGKEESSSGLYYYGARYYDPDVGRFITRDPVKGTIKTPQSFNQYAYCLNNPLTYVDPWGEKTFHKEGGYPGGKITVEEIEPLESETGKYFENEDGEGFIFIEGDIEKSGSIAVALGFLHNPGSATDPDHGLVIFLYDDSGHVADVEFISFTTLQDPDSGAIGNIVNQLDEKGLINRFKAVLQALENQCDDKQLLASIGGATGALSAAAISKLGGTMLGAAANPVGSAVACGSLVYFFISGVYWNNNESSINDLVNAI
jgi:RHS repeat-associated protein